MGLPYIPFGETPDRIVLPYRAGSPMANNQYFDFSARRYANTQYK
ncbi:hypothetical protein WKK05_32300 [Nostoc sp. UHCC 0302]